MKQRTKTQNLYSTVSMSLVFAHLVHFLFLRSWSVRYFLDGLYSYQQVSNKQRQYNSQNIIADSKEILTADSLSLSREGCLRRNDLNCVKHQFASILSFVVVNSCHHQSIIKTIATFVKNVNLALNMLYVISFYRHYTINRNDSYLLQHQARLA